MNNSFEFIRWVISLFLGVCGASGQSIENQIEKNQAIEVAIVSIAGDRQTSELLQSEERICSLGEIVYFLRSDRRSVPVVEKSLDVDGWWLRVQFQEDVGECINRALSSVDRGSCLMGIWQVGREDEALVFPVDRLSRTRIQMRDNFDIDLLGLRIGTFTEQEVDQIIGRLERGIPGSGDNMNLQPGEESAPTDGRPRDS